MKNYAGKIIYDETSGKQDAVLVCGMYTDYGTVSSHVYCPFVLIIYTVYGTVPSHVYCPFLLMPINQSIFILSIGARMRAGFLESWLSKPALKMHKSY